MDTIRIRGGVPLSGELAVSGSKNAALPILAAALLIREPIELTHLPNISDVADMLGILASRGALIERAGERCRIRAPLIPCMETVCEEGRLRGSLYLLGAMLGAYGEARVALPGGCDLGGRPFDLHLEALSALGAEVAVGDGVISARAARLRGTEYTFPAVSVGATVNAILAATAAKGKTVLRGAAREPHIVDLIAFLNSAGAEILVPTPGVIVVNGAKPLHATKHWIIPDMIEAGTYLLAATATRGNICLRNAPIGQLASLFKPLSEMGAHLSLWRSGEIELRALERPRPTDLVAEPYPGFPTDLHPQAAAVLSLARGESRITEKVFPGRFRYVLGLSELGADLKNEGAVLNIRGVETLHGATVRVPDLRGGASLLIAALAAEGETRLLGTSHLARGYASLIPRLRSLGAIIEDGGGASASLLREDRRE